MSGRGWVGGDVGLAGDGMLAPRRDAVGRWPFPVPTPTSSSPADGMFTKPPCSAPVATRPHHPRTEHGMAGCAVTRQPNRRAQSSRRETQHTTQKAQEEGEKKESQNIHNKKEILHTQPAL